MKLTRRAFLAVAASTMLVACGGGKKETEEAEVVEEPAEVEPVVTELTNYAVYRCDYKRGILGDFEAITENTQDFSAFYATITPEGNLSFDINGVVFNGTVERGKQTKTLYSGIEDCEATQLMIDGRDHGNVGTVDFEMYLVDNDVLVDMTTSDDEGMIFANFYLRKS
jgi:hypothetical protein